MEDCQLGTILCARTLTMVPGGYAIEPIFYVITRESRATFYLREIDRSKKDSGTFYVDNVVLKSPKEIPLRKKSLAQLQKKGSYLPYQGGDVQSIFHASP